MKSAHVLITLAALAFAATASAQTSIWRCGNTYTNDEAQARSLNCARVEGGNVTVVTGTRVNGAGVQPKPVVSLPSAPSASGSAGQRVDSAEQKARDANARLILEAELKKAEARHAELLKEWNNGQPDKLGPETRNYQKYLDRVAELKAAIERNEKDIAGLKRELGRTTAAK